MFNFEIHPLDKTYDKSSFDCGYEQLNDFIQTRARQNQTLGFNKTFVAIVKNDKAKKILGFYCLSMGEIDLPSLPPEIVKKLPKHPVPVARMGRLAVDKSAKGQGLGQHLLVDAMKRVQAAASSVGVYALLVDAKDVNAKSFYQKYGFLELTSNPMTLFLPLASFP